MDSDATRAKNHREFRIAVLCATAVLIAFVAGIAPRFTQPEEYHRFANQEAALGIPNFCDVASNLGFLVVGVMGLYFVVRGTHSDARPAFTDAAG